MVSIARLGLGVVVLFAVAVAIPTAWMPTVVGITVGDGGVEVTYNESAASTLFGTGGSGGEPAGVPESSPETTAPAGTEQPTTARAATATDERSDRERTRRLVHERINEVRAEHGLAPLDYSAQLEAVAQYHSEDMADREYFAHTGPNGETVSDRYASRGIDCAGGENIFWFEASYGVSPEQAASEAVSGWMDSPGHRENILRSRFRAEGIGVAFAGDQVYITQNFC